MAINAIQPMIGINRQMIAKTQLNFFLRDKVMLLSSLWIVEKFLAAYCATSCFISD